MDIGEEIVDFTIAAVNRCVKQVNDFRSVASRVSTKEQHIALSSFSAYERPTKKKPQSDFRQVFIANHKIVLQPDFLFVMTLFFLLLVLGLLLVF